MQVCAKTGTAELGENKQNNGWMVGFSQNDSTPYAFVVVVENTSQYGYQSAGQVASGLMKAAKNLKK
jgi:peptidoglycan glycosyltransferase